MSLNTTTTTAAMKTTDTTVAVTSATGFAIGRQIRIDQEWMQVAQGYDGSSLNVPVLRGRDGTVTAAHVSGANITVGIAASDFGLPPSGVDEATTILPCAAITLTSYGASGAITVPTAVGIYIAVLNGTSTLAMTLANPTKDIDGTILFIVGNGKSASTIDLPDAQGFNNATGASGYDTLTFQNAGQVATMLIAMNGVWCVPTFPGWTGTVTALTGAIA